MEETAVAGIIHRRALLKIFDHADFLDGVSIWGVARVRVFKGLDISWVIGPVHDNKVYGRKPLKTRTLDNPVVFFLRYPVKKTVMISNLICFKRCLCNILTGHY